ncbi:hypothetical protein TRVA0_001S07162 [Trichomonascus vanleenenianus]|uniref:uncharacterized protein n=1 Tax=Trichomonascus vanleenenianus TaxID=2268995 RepID=UPI003EC9EA5F
MEATASGVMSPEVWYLVLDHLDRPILRCLAVSNFLYQIAIRKLSARLHITEGEPVRLELANGDRIIYAVEADQNNLDKISRRLRWVRRLNVKLAAHSDADKLVSIVDTLFKSADLNALNSSISKEKVIQDALKVYRLCVETDSAMDYQASQLELNFVPPVVDDKKVYHFPGTKTNEAIIKVDEDYDLNLKIFDLPFTCYSKTNVAPHITNLQWQVEEVESWPELQDWLYSCSRLSSLEVIFNLEEEEEEEDIKIRRRLVVPPSLRYLSISGDVNLTVVAQNCEELDCPAADFGRIQFECPSIVNLNIMLDDEVALSEQEAEIVDEHVKKMNPRNLNVSFSRFRDITTLSKALSRVSGAVSVESDLGYAYRSYNAMKRGMDVNRDSGSSDSETLEVFSDEELDAEMEDSTGRLAGLRQLADLTLHCEQFSLLLTEPTRDLVDNLKEVFGQLVARNDKLKGIESSYFPGCEAIGHWDGVWCYIPQTHFYKLYE